MKTFNSIHERLFMLVIGLLLLLFLYGIDFSLIIGEQHFRFSLTRITTPLFCEFFLTSEIIFLISIKALLKPWLSSNLGWFLTTSGSYAYCLPNIFGVLSWKLYEMDLLYYKYPKIHTTASYLIHVIIPFLGALTFFSYIPFPHKFFYPLIWTPPVIIYYLKYFKGIKNSFLAAIASCTISHCIGDTILVITNTAKYTEKNWSYFLPTYIFMLLLFATGMYMINVVIKQKKAMKQH